MVPVSDHMAEAVPNDGVSGALSKFTTNRVATDNLLDWSRLAQSNCASQSQTAHDERHAHCAADVFLLHDVNAHHATEAPPHAVIVGSSKVGN